jgi:gamma-glutamyltranspeptidase/glutathione hydrolase
MGEAMRRAFADRARWRGDPAFVDVPAEALADSLYVRRRMASFRPDATTPSAEVGAGTPAPRPEGSETTHYSIVDEEGTAVAVTTTINDYFGSKVVVDGAGFSLNDEMDDFTSAPGRPNLWGLVQGEANAVRPGARPASSMTPTIVEDPRGRLRLVLGSPGGARIITTVFQVVTNVLDHGFDVQTAVSLPRFHHQWLPDVLEVEGAFPDEPRPALEARGWAVNEVSTFGAADAILVEYGRDGAPRLYGGADPRRENDTALGY